MARLHRLFIGDESNTNFFELEFRIVGTPVWTELTFTPPLPTYTSVSPAIESAYIGIQPLADGTDYEYRVRRFNNDNQYSDWVEGTFTTGS